MENARPRLSYQRVQRRHTASAENRFLIKAFRQLIVCALIAAVLFAVSKIDVPFCKSITAGVKSTLSYTVDYKATAISIYERVKKLMGKEEIAPEQAPEQAPENTSEETADVKAD